MFDPILLILFTFGYRLLKWDNNTVPVLPYPYLNLNFITKYERTVMAIIPHNHCPVSDENEV